MKNAVVLAVTFERPANFDLAAHWKTATALLQQKRTQFQATLALAADAALSISRWCRALPAPDVQATPGLPDGWTILHVSFESMEEARFLALALGARVHVLAPASLRELVLEELQAAVKRPVVHTTGA
jgi:predicted DNA-binding transcriptional regulator YafY